MNYRQAVKDVGFTVTELESGILRFAYVMLPNDPPAFDRIAWMVLERTLQVAGIRELASATGTFESQSYIEIDVKYLPRLDSVVGS